jgi:hypothetical protein
MFISCCGSIGGRKSKPAVDPVPEQETDDEEHVNAPSPSARTLSPTVPEEADESPAPKNKMKKKGLFILNSVLA